MGALTRAVLKNECSLLTRSVGQDADIGGDLFVHDYVGEGGKQTRCITKQKLLSPCLPSKQSWARVLGGLPCAQRTVIFLPVALRS